MSSSGGLARYRLVVESWLAFLRERLDSYFWSQLNEGGVTIRRSMEANTEYFQSARLVLDYWPDRTISDARASIEVEEED